MAGSARVTEFAVTDETAGGEVQSGHCGSDPARSGGRESGRDPRAGHAILPPVESDDTGPDASPADGPALGGSGAGASRWERSFAEQARRGGSSQLVSWAIGGVVAVIILTFVLGALL